MKISKILLLVSITAAIPVFSLSAQAKSSSATNNFIHTASISGLFEVESSKLALKKSQNQDVKTFAQQMIDDHSAADKELKSTVSSAGDDTTQLATSLDAKHQSMLDKLNTENGTAFDKQYVSIQTDAHKEAVSLFSNYSKNGDDAAIKAFASKTLPTLEGHLQHVEQLHSSVK